MDCNNSQTGFYKGGSGGHQPSLPGKQHQTVRNHKTIEAPKWRPQQQKKSIGGELEDATAADGSQKPKNLKGGRGVNSMNLNNNSINSMNSSSM